jgi:hypothetical protein
MSKDLAGFRNPQGLKEETMQLRKFFLFSLIIAVALAACNNQGPIDVSNPIGFKQKSGLFALQVPKSWTSSQDEVATESIAAFADPTHRAELIGYVGLLDHLLSDAEGLQTAESLAGNLLNHPNDLKTTNQYRQADGAFVVVFTFTRSGAARTGQAIFRDGDLAFSGTLIDGPVDGWADLQKALQPFVDSFKMDKDYVQGTYFVPIDTLAFSVVVPADWTQQKSSNSNEVQIKAPNGRFSIIGVQRVFTNTLDDTGLANEATSILKQVYGFDNTLSDSSKLADGRLKLGLDQTDRHTVGYVEQKDGYFIGLFFDVPTAQLSDYQPFIDFVYSTFVTSVAP